MSAGDAVMKAGCASAVAARLSPTCNKVDDAEAPETALMNKVRPAADRHGICKPWNISDEAVSPLAEDMYARLLNGVQHSVASVQHPVLIFFDRYSFNASELVKVADSTSVNHSLTWNISENIAQTG